LQISNDHDEDLPAIKPHKKRQRDFIDTESFQYSTRIQSIHTALKMAVTYWDTKHQAALCKHTSVRLSGSHWRLSAFCGKCETCHRGDGKVFSFKAQPPTDHVLQVKVATAGECCEKPRLTRKDASGNKILQIKGTVEELVRNGHRVTPSAIAFMLGRNGTTLTTDSLR
jgi:hypothetical protein